MNTISKNILNKLFKYSILCILLLETDSVYASNLNDVKTMKSNINILFDIRMIGLLLVVVLIVSVLLGLYGKKQIQKKKSEQIEYKDQINNEKFSNKREEFKKLEEKYKLLREEKKNIEEQNDDLSKTVLLSKVTLDINKKDFEKIQERMNSAITEAEVVAEEVVSNDDENKEIVSPMLNEKDTETDEKVLLPGDIDESVIEENKEENSENTDKSLSELNNELKDEYETRDNEINVESVEDTETLNDYRKIGTNVKNIIEKNLELKRIQINEYITCLFDNIYEKMESKSVINAFIYDYVNVKYLKQCECAAPNVKSLKKIVNAELDKTAKKLISDINRSYSDEYIRLVYDMFIVINKIDNVDNRIEDVISDCNSLNFISRVELIKKLNKIFKSYANMYKDYLKKLYMDKFGLIVNKIDAPDLFEPGNLVMTNISSSIQFSKIFSDYIIDKTYSSDIIMEDIREVQLKLISFHILDDMLNINFKRKYMIYLPPSLYKKEKKLLSLLRGVGDLYSQNKVFILIDVEILKKYNDVIGKLKKEGYKFIIQLDETGMKLYDELKTTLSYIEYIIFVGQRVGKKTMKECIPSYLLKKIIYLNKNLIEGVVVK